MLNRLETLEAYRNILAQATKDDCEVEALRHLCKTDLYFLLTQACGRDDITYHSNADWLYDRIREVEKAPNGFLDLWAREHYKSTIITFGLTITNILNNPEVTIGIFSHTRPIAKGFLRQIKSELESNDLLKRIFPDILWDRPRSEAPKWSEDAGIVVKREGNPKEATIEAYGLVDGQPTSKHFMVMVYDDVVTLESVTTPDQIRKVTSAWEVSRALSADGGGTRYIGTRYHFNDTYKAILERMAAHPRVYPGTDTGLADGKPVLFSEEYNREKRTEMGSYVYSCQILQNPVADASQGFKVEWIQTWPATHFANQNIYMICDPANEKKKQSDYTSIFIVGMGEDDCYYIIDMVRDRLNLTERTERIISLHRQYRPIKTGYERYGKDSDIQHIKYVMARENYRFHIYELGGQMSKADRIRKLIPLFEGRRVYLPDQCIKTNYEGITEDLTKAFIHEEYLAFPVSLHDDMLDCLARVCDPDMHVRPPKPSNRIVDNSLIPVQRRRKGRAKMEWNELA